MEDSLIKAWEEANSQERAKFITSLCKLYPSLICETLKKQANCKRLICEDYLFGEKPDKH